MRRRQWGHRTYELAEDQAGYFTAAQAREAAPDRFAVLPRDTDAKPPTALPPSAGVLTKYAQRARAENRSVDGSIPPLATI